MDNTKQPKEIILLGLFCIVVPDWISQYYSKFAISTIL